MNAVIYARYSSDRQTEQSIEGQLRECRAFAASEGINIIGEYIDRAISGTTANRPEFQRMIADSRYKTFQAVIVYKLDRFARNRYDSTMYKSKLKANGVWVLSAKEHITDSPEGIILEGLLEAMIVLHLTIYRYKNGFQKRSPQNQIPRAAFLLQVLMKPIRHIRIIDFP